MADILDQHHSQPHPLSIAPSSPEPQSHSPEPSTLSTPIPRSVSKRSRPYNRKTSECGTEASRLFSTLLEAHQQNPLVERPIIVRNVSLGTWKYFLTKHGQHPAFKISKWEYDNGKVIAVPLPLPFHNIAPTILIKYFYFNLRTTGLANRERIFSLRLTYENMTKRGPSGISTREPNVAIWTPGFHLGVVPTLIWEVTHTQPRSSFQRRAKMWCRRYDGQVRVIIFLKYLRKNPLTGRASILEVYRPACRNGRWTAVKDGPTYELFPVPANAGGEMDAVPLTLEDYFGAGNTCGGQIDPGRRFDLPLGLVRKTIEEIVGVTVARLAYRSPSDGSGVAGDMQVSVSESRGGDGLSGLGDGMDVEGGGESTEVVDYEEFGSEWDATMSDVSDDV